MADRLRYICTAIPTSKLSDLSNSEECNVQSVVTTNAHFISFTTDKSSSFLMEISTLTASYGSLFQNYSRRFSFVVLRPVYYNGFPSTQQVPDMVRIFVRLSAVENALDKHGLANLEKMCAEHMFAETMRDLALKNVIVVEQYDTSGNLVSQRSAAPLNKSEVRGNGKLASEQRQSAEGMLNTIITAGLKESPRSLAYVPWIEVTESIVFDTDTWNLQRNALGGVPLTKIQAVCRSEYTRRFADTLGFLMCPRGAGRRRTISACVSMLNSYTHDTDAFLESRRKTHPTASFLAMSTCLIVCAPESMEKWEAELSEYVAVMCLRVPADLNQVTKESIEGTTILLSTALLLYQDKVNNVEMHKNVILNNMKRARPSFHFPMTLDDSMLQRLYVNDIIERFHSSVLPLLFIHFRTVIFNDVENISTLPTFFSDWTWIAHVTDEATSFVPPLLLLNYGNKFSRLQQESTSQSQSTSLNKDLHFKWRLLHGEGGVVSFAFPRVLLHKLQFKAVKIPISKHENLFFSVIKSLVDLQSPGIVLKKNDYIPLLLGGNAFDVNGCSIDLVFSRKQCGVLNIEKNLEKHFEFPCGGTTFAQKIINNFQIKSVHASSTDTGGGVFVLDSLRKTLKGESICGICYCDPVEIFCFCGHGYCKPCTDIFSRNNTVITNCPTCRLPLSAFDWINVCQQQGQPNQNQIEMVNFAAFGAGYSATSYKSLARVQAITQELNVMFKTRSKSLSECIIVAPDQCIKNMQQLLKVQNASFHFRASLACLNPEEGGKSVILLSFSEFMNLNLDSILMKSTVIMGILFATPPPPQFSKCYITATRIANLKGKNGPKSIPLIVHFSQEFEQDEMLVGRKILKRDGGNNEDDAPVRRSHPNSITSQPSGSSPRRP